MRALAHALHKNVAGKTLGQCVHRMHHLHCRGELIAAAGNGYDRTGLIAQRLAQRGDVLVQVVLFDEGIGPDGLKQLLLGNHAAGVERQVSENIQTLRGERNGDAVPLQDPCEGIQLKTIKAI